MDRSFLSSPAVIKASRNFVCIRLATYEDQEEANFLRKIYLGRSGDLENTVFCLLAPDGRRRLSQAGRSPRFAYDSPDDMAEAMDELAFQYPGRPDDDATYPLPRMKNLRLALNVAACDGLPLAVAFAKDDKQRADLAAKLAQAALADSIAGRFAFYDTSDAVELGGLVDLQPQSGIYVVQPGTFGLKGTIVGQLAPDLSSAALIAHLSQLADQSQQLEKQHRTHVRAGRSQGANWETEIPVTDEMALRAQQRRNGR